MSSEEGNKREQGEEGGDGEGFFLSVSSKKDRSRERRTSVVLTREKKSALMRDARKRERGRNGAREKAEVN